MSVILFYLNLLLITAIFLMVYYILINKRAKIFVGKYYLVFILIIILSLIYKLPFDFTFFQGLEYEDSYLANSVSRYLMYNRNNTEPFYLATTCGIGALNNCIANSTHSGNLIGLSTIVWSINELLGYNIKNIAIVNLVFSIISTVSIFLISYKINKSYLFGLIASIVFITTPVLNSFHTSSLFETSSSSLIVISLLVFILYFENRNSNKNSFVLFLIMITINLVSIHFKRENIIIISFPFIMLFIRLLESKKSLWHGLKDLLPYLMFLIGIGLYYVYILDIPSSLEVERDYAIGNSFQLKFFLPLFTMFIKGFSTFSWFYFFGLFVIVGIIFAFSDIKKNPLLLYPLIIFIVFILINSIHHRSYYFVRSGAVSAFDSLRHINMLSPFFAIISGYGIYKLIDFVKSLNIIRGKLVLIIYPVVISLFIHLFILTYITRKDLIEIEQSNRIIPISELLKFVDQNNDVVITDQSILLHNYCQENLTIIEFTALGNHINEDEIRTLLKKSDIYFLWKEYFNESIFRNRYKNSIETLEKFNLSEVSEGDGFEVLKLNCN